MSDRKYRQRGYQDDPREPRRDQRPPDSARGRPEKKDYAPRGQPPIAPKTFNMPGFREVVRCTRCGHELTVASAWSVEATCPKCASDLHTCAQCVHFDTSAAFECQQPVPTRISPKDARNACTFYEPRTTVERETKSTGGPPSARKAFDDLFK